MRLLPCLAASCLVTALLAAQQSPTAAQIKHVAAGQVAQDRADPQRTGHEDHDALLANCAPAPEPAPVTIAPPPQAPPLGGGPVPEPSTLFLVGTGLVGVALTARRRRRLRDS